MTDLEKATVQDIVLFYEEVAGKYDGIEYSLLNESILSSTWWREAVRGVWGATYVDRCLRAGGAFAEGDDMVTPNTESLVELLYGRIITTSPHPSGSSKPHHLLLAR